MRIPEDLLEWADAYAAERGVSRTALVTSALESLRDDAGRGVPELGQASGIGDVRAGTMPPAHDDRVAAEAPSRPSPPAPARVSGPTRAELNWARQKKLNEGRS
jgi:hypothetical protein